MESQQDSRQPAAAQQDRAFAWSIWTRNGHATLQLVRNLDPLAREKPSRQGGFVELVASTAKHHQVGPLDAPPVVALLGEVQAMLGEDVAASVRDSAAAVTAH
jgi:hypothetical protein